jgi:hypothetical protein
MITRRLMIGACLAGTVVPAAGQGGGGGSPALYPDGDPYQSRPDAAEEREQRRRRELRERLIREAEARRARVEAARNPQGRRR